MKRIFYVTALRGAVIGFALLTLFSTTFAAETGQLDPLEWERAGKMPVALSNPAVVAYKDRIYLFGGNDEKGASSTALMFDPFLREWTFLPRLPHPRFGHSAAVIHDRIYLFGGKADRNGKPYFVSAIESFDPVKREWQNHGHMPFERARFGFAVFARKLYFIGGESPKFPAVNSVDVFDPRTGKWDSRKPLPFPLSRNSAALCGGSLFVLGGENQYGRTVPNVWEYVPERDSWKEGPSLITPRKNFAVARLGTRLVVAGGWDRRMGTTTFHKTVETFRPGDTAWRSAGILHQGRDGTRLANFHGTLFLFGGYNGRILDDVETGAWMSRGSDWRVDEEMKFHLGFFRSDEMVMEKYGRNYPSSLGLFPDFKPDIDNIKLSGIRALGFSLPSRESEEFYSFFLKFYRYPDHLDHRVSLERILLPLRVQWTGNRSFLDYWLKPPGHVVIKKGTIDFTKREFSARQPIPPLVLPSKPRRIVRHWESPQEYFDTSLPFSSLYIKPKEDVATSLPDKTLGPSTAAGIPCFRDEIASLCLETFVPVSGPRNEELVHFLDDCDSDFLVESACRVNLVSIPRRAMIFDSFRDKPMPQDPSKVFLSGLLLVYRDSFLFDRNIGYRSLGEGEVLYRTGVPRERHVFEVGSVVRFP